MHHLLVDGESSEGSVWATCSFAPIHKLDNLVAIFDVNCLGQSQPAPPGHQTDVYEDRLEVFGMGTHVVDELVKMLNTAKTSENGKPKAIICKTFKQLEAQLSSKSTSLKPKSPARQESAKPNLETKLAEAPGYAIDANG